MATTSQTYISRLLSSELSYCPDSIFKPYTFVSTHSRAFLSLQNTSQHHHQSNGPHTQPTQKMKTTTALATLTALAASAAAAALDFGDCANPAIEFAAAADRGGANAFQAADQADFNHGSANNINVISDFICQQLASSCGAAQDAVDACDEAKAAADGLSGQAAADAFNDALGVSA